MVMELGRLVYDVRVNEVGEKNHKVLNNRLAINIGKERTTYIDIVAWNGTAELIGKYYKKGYEILIEGELINRKRQYTQDNNDISFEIDTIAILVSKVYFTHGNKKNSSEYNDLELPNDEYPDILQ